jgi:hypothetical protein
VTPANALCDFARGPNRASAYLSATAITDDTSMNEAERFVDAAEKEEMIMSTKSKMPSLVALAIVIATLAFAGQRTQPTKHESPAGELAFSVDPSGARPGSAAYEKQSERRLQTCCLP